MILLPTKGSQSEAGAPNSSKMCAGQKAFSLVEILLVIAVIATISGLAISYVGGASDSSSVLVARQQQVQLQTALDAWIAAKSSGTTGLAGARSIYSTNASAMLTNLAPYLRDSAIFSISGTGLSSQALGKAGKTLQFSSWADGGIPKFSCNERTVSI